MTCEVCYDPNHETGGHILSDTEMAYSVLVYVKRHPTNVVHGEAWIPPGKYVADEIKSKLVGRDLDTGWDIVDVLPGNCYPVK
jgi:hypothetical protein